MDLNQNNEEVRQTTLFSEVDIKIFENLLPTLYSDAARDTDFAKDERKQMMERFQKSFGN